MTTDVASLGSGQARRTLLLDPTGHIRADAHVAFDGEGFWLLQSPDQDDIGAALSPYVLSSDVQVEDRSTATDPGRATSEARMRRSSSGFRPSVLGVGFDLLSRPDDGAARWVEARVPVGTDAIEVWRVRRGVARMGSDFDGPRCPAEAGLSSAIDVTKAASWDRNRCLGQEPRSPAPVVHRLAAASWVEEDTEILDDRGALGRQVTSAAAGPDFDGTSLLATIRWEARNGLLRTESGVALPVGEMD